MTAIRPTGVQMLPPTPAGYHVVNEARGTVDPYLTRKQADFYARQNGGVVRPVYYGSECADGGDDEPAC